MKLELTNLKPLDGTVCYWTGCQAKPARDGLCEAHLAACKCRGPGHFPGEGCDDDLDESGVCSACRVECGALTGERGQ